MLAAMLDLAEFRDDPIGAAFFMGRVADAIERSFAEDLSRRTGAEVQRRFNLCVDIFRTLRHKPFCWGLSRIADMLGPALRQKLDGVPWSPERQRKTWAPPRPIPIIRR